MRWRGALILFGSLLCSCERDSEATAAVELRLGPDASLERTFEAVTSLAEYIEVPGAGNELRLTLASYDADCDAFKPPGPDQTSVSIVITTPTGVAPTPGVYPWAGHTAHGGEVHNPTKAYAFPTARIGSKSYLFEPGGGVVLKELSLGKHGSVTGLLNFEFSGDAKHPARSLKGRFSARMCRFSSTESS